MHGATHIKIILKGKEKDTDKTVPVSKHHRHKEGAGIRLTIRHTNGVQAGQSHS
jgi:hypothetical protein